MTNNNITTFDEAVYASIKTENRELDALVNHCTRPRALAKRRADKTERFGLIVCALLWAALALLTAILAVRGFLPISIGAFVCLTCICMAVIDLRLLGARKRGEGR